MRRGYGTGKAAHEKATQEWRRKKCNTTKAAHKMQRNESGARYAAQKTAGKFHRKKNAENIHHRKKRNKNTQKSRKGRRKRAAPPLHRFSNRSSSGTARTDAHNMPRRRIRPKRCQTPYSRSCGSTGTPYVPKRSRSPQRRCQRKQPACSPFPRRRRLCLRQSSSTRRAINTAPTWFPFPLV